ncbi:MAG: hypothetical protein ACXITV_09725 [Luteibaculaceae bacterium]
MIYRLTYFFIYLIARKRNPDPMFYSAGVVAFMQLVHFLFPFAILNKFFDIRVLPHFSDIYLINKLMVMPFLLIWLIVVHWWFKKHFKDIEETFSDRKVITLKNGIIVFGSLIIPLAISILLLTK